MNKNDNIHTLSAILNGCLPHEYDQKLADDGTALVITKEGSDLAMRISPDENNDDEFVMAYGHDDPNRGYFTEYEQIDVTIDNIKHYL